MTAPPASAAPSSSAGPWWRDASAALTPRFALGATLAVTAVHLALWARASEPFGALLNHWDSGHYSAIARDGYSGALWVFYPAYPLLVRGVASALHVAEVQWVGFALSTALFFVAAALIASRAATPGLPDGLVPRTRLGWLFFVLGPASYVFHSHHTESLFLLLSFAAFYFAGTRRAALAGLFAAACCVTRNQGVFVGLCAALLAASLETGWRSRLKALLVTGGLALGGVAAFLSFEAMAAGSAFAFAGAQGAWAHVDSPWGALKTLAFANPWQSTDRENVLRYVGWWVFVLGSAWLLRRTPALGLYALLCFLVQLPQGELVNTWRFAAPVFPLFFALGDEAGRRPLVHQVGAVLVLLAANLETTWRYAQGLWAY